METNIEKLERRIFQLGLRYSINNRFSLDGINGEIISKEKPEELYTYCEPEVERIANLTEVVKLRVRSFEELFTDIIDLEERIDKISKGKKKERYDLARDILQTMDEKGEKYSVWKRRLTTSSHMVRTDSKSGQDTVFFYHGDPFGNKREMIKAFTGELSDGGIKYSEKALNKIREETPTTSQLLYEKYLKARGGNFTGYLWLNHPIFSTAIGDRELLIKYVYAMQVLNVIDFYNQGLHSGWRPGEMKKDYGRAISLGHKGEAFYPPNASTIHHAALILPHDLKIF